MVFCDIKSTLKHYLITNCCALPPIPLLIENGLEVAGEECSGILQVFFGVGAGLGDAVKGFVEDGDYALLFSARGHAGMKGLGLGEVNGLMNSAAGKAKKIRAFGQK